MNVRRQIPPAVTERQIAASDPASSAWVSANAGSGKTHVLAQRVIRLLLSGVEPGRILCITFTKAAAANMANRVFGILREWTALPDEALDGKLRDVGIKRPGPRERERARRLFALALETPGGLKVQTIHAFCTSLLHLFPFEANVAARFEVLDDAAEVEMLERLTFDVMLEAAADPDSALGRALGVALLARADVTLRDAIREAIRHRDRITQWIAAAGGLDAALSKGCRARSALRRLIPLQASKRSSSRRSMSRRANGTRSPRPWARARRPIRIRRRAFAPSRISPARSGSKPISTFSAPATAPRPATASSRTQSASPSPHSPCVSRTNAAACGACCSAAARSTVRDRSAALITLAHAVIARFRAEKDRRGLLDYEDLIGKTLDLLRDDRAAWVHYKLDRGIHHVLIDEAQDTSPRQWDIIDRLVAEFFAGEGAHARPRTIFAVGDEKQSIFSFQGAAPSRLRRYAACISSAPMRAPRCPSSRPNSNIRSVRDPMCSAPWIPYSRASRPMRG